MNAQLAKTVAFILTLLLYVLTESILILAMASVVSIFYLIPPEHMSKVLGYVTLVDISMSMYVVSVGTASATATGLILAVFTALGISFVLRAFRTAIGCQRMRVNGTSSIGGIIAEFSTYGISFIRSWIGSLIKGSRVNAPEPLDVEWVQHKQGIGWWNTLLYYFGRYELPEYAAA